MFDVALSELVIIAVVALVVIGPERLPGVARTVGHLLGRARRYVDNVKADINREIQLDELKKLQAQMSESAQQLESSMREQFEALQAPLEEAIRPPADAAPLPTPPSETLPPAPALVDKTP